MEGGGAGIFLKVMVRAPSLYVVPTWLMSYPTGMETLRMYMVELISSTNT